MFDNSDLSHTKQNENESESVILVFVFLHSHSPSHSYIGLLNVNSHSIILIQSSLKMFDNFRPLANLRTTKLEKRCRTLFFSQHFRSHSFLPSLRDSLFKQGLKNFEYLIEKSSHTNTFKKSLQFLNLTVSRSFLSLSPKQNITCS